MSLQDNVWAAAESSSDRAEAPASGEGRRAGGQTPDILQLVTETAQEMMAEPLGYGLAGLGFFLILVPAVVLGAILPLLGMMPGLLANDPDLMSAGMLGGLGLLFLLLPLITALSVPIQASLYRALWQHELTGEPLGLRSPFSRMFRDLIPMELGFLGILGLGIVGAMMCYLPGLLVGIFIIFVLPAIAIHGLGVVEAFKLSFTHVKEHFVWHLALWGVNLAVLLVAGNIPIVGYLLGIPFHYALMVKAYRYAFGDGDKPYGWEG